MARRLHGRAQQNRRRPAAGRRGGPEPARDVAVLLTGARTAPQRRPGITSERRHIGIPELMTSLPEVADSSKAEGCQY
jgi:hypothetical protein